jgi:hypothetical protein
MPSETAARTGILALYLVAILSLALAPLLMPAGYDWVRHTTSESAAQGLDGAWLARLGFVAFGLAVLASAAIPLAMVAVGDVAGLAQRGMFAIAFAWYLTRTLGPPLEPAGAGSRPLATGGGSG